jgi:hypothetical protein
MSPRGHKFPGDLKKMLCRDQPGCKRRYRRVGPGRASQDARRDHSLPDWRTRRSPLRVQRLQSRALGRLLMRQSPLPELRHGEVRPLAEGSRSQSCEATYRNVIQGRFGQASEPMITKSFPVDRPGKWRASAATDHALIRGDPNASNPRSPIDDFGNL